MVNKMDNISFTVNTHTGVGKVLAPPRLENKTCNDVFVYRGWCYSLHGLENKTCNDVFVYRGWCSFLTWFTI